MAAVLPFRRSSVERSVSLPCHCSLSSEGSCRREAGRRRQPTQDIQRPRHVTLRVVRTSIILCRTSHASGLSDFGFVHDVVDPRTDHLCLAMTSPSSVKEETCVQYHAVYLPPVMLLVRCTQRRDRGCRYLSTSGTMETLSLLFYSTFFVAGRAVPVKYLEKLSWTTLRLHLSLFALLLRELCQLRGIDQVRMKRSSSPS